MALSKSSVSLNLAMHLAIGHSHKKHPLVESLMPDMQDAKQACNDSIENGLKYVDDY